MSGKGRGRAQRADNTRKNARKAKGLGESRSDGRNGSVGLRPAATRALSERVTIATCPVGALATSFVYGAPTANQKEVRYSITDFFDFQGNDTTQKVFAVLCSLKQDFIGAPSSEVGGSGEVVSRIRAVDAWVLPRAINAQVAASAFIASTAVLARAPSDGDSTDNFVLCNARNTVVKPDFDVRWIKVLSWKADTLFRNTILTPSVNAGIQEIFRISCVDTDTGDVIEGPVQVMYTVEFAQVLPALATAKLETQAKGDWTTPATFSVSDQFALVEIKGLGNST